VITCFLAKIQLLFQIFLHFIHSSIFKEFDLRELIIYVASFQIILFSFHCWLLVLVIGKIIVIIVEGFRNIHLVLNGRTEL